MEFKKVSVKNFIGDLPNIINSNFAIVKAFVEKIYNEATDTLKTSNLEVKSRAVANTVVANNIIIQLDNGKKVSLAELIARLKALEEISKSKADADDSNDNERIMLR